MMSSDDSITGGCSGNKQAQQDDDDDEMQKLLWSCIARNDVILAEAGYDPCGGAVVATAQGLLHKKGTAGWEYHSNGLRNPFKKNNLQLKGVKFHLLDGASANITWVFCVVYNPRHVQLVEVQSFVEKIIGYVYQIKMMAVHILASTSLALSLSLSLGLSLSLALSLSLSL